MSKPVNSARARAAPPTMHRLRESRLRENFKIANQMKPYGNRLRFRLVHFDLADQDNKLRLEDARREMTNILIKKKIREEEAQRAVAEALDVAADHQLEALRRDKCLRDLSRSKGFLKRLRKQLDRLNQAISKLPPLAKGKLNKIVVEQDWQNFDTETFAKLIRAMADTLANLSPACIANKASWAMNESARGSKDPAVAQIARTAPPVIFELWETIPAGTRTQVEADLRNWLPSTRRPAAEFLNHFSALLGKFRPRRKRGRWPPIERRFGERVARIWNGLGLRVGRAFSGKSEYSGTFQRFIRVALTAVGDDTRLSNRQVVNLKSDIRRKRDSTSKLLK
jgi:hypothetical protein